MSKYSQLRPEFFSALASGVPSTRVLQQVPPHLVERWTERFYKVKRPTSLPVCPRLLNHFKVGADPEFALLLNGKQQAASEYGLLAGLAFGADNNGRLVELRPRASRFVLEVLASILVELRWFAIMKPTVLPLTWKAGAYSGLDGLGGHVHFGHKQTSLTAAKAGKGRLSLEVEALDKVNRLLHAVGMFSTEEMALRNQKKYGMLGDWRPQVHGYEYRSFPSWMGSPWIAYLTMVLAKLAVLQPQTFCALKIIPGQASLGRKQVRSLLAYFKGLDDDALLAYCGMDVWGIPAFPSLNADFKQAWGILETPMPPGKLPTILPLSMPPSLYDVQNMFLHILQGRSLYGAQQTEPNWPFQHPPQGFDALIQQLDTRLSPGLGELVWDVVKPKGLALSVGFIPEGHDPAHKVAHVQASIDLVTKLGIARFKGYPFSSQVQPTLEGDALCFNKTALNAAHLPVTKQWLLTCGLPLARYDNVTGRDFSWPLPAKPQHAASVSLYEGA